jgi:hypothetical protein
MVKGNFKFKWTKERKLDRPNEKFKDNEPNSLESLEPFWTQKQINQKWRKTKRGNRKEIRNWNRQQKIN